MRSRPACLTMPSLRQDPSEPVSTIRSTARSWNDVPKGNQVILDQPNPGKDIRRSKQ